MRRADAIDERSHHGQHSFTARLPRRFARHGSVLVEVVTAKQELVMPPKIERERAKGVGLVMPKAIVDRRGDEMVALTRTHLTF